MLCVSADQRGKIVVDTFQPSNPVECQGHVLVTPSEYTALISTVTLDPVDLGAVWGFAFATVLSFWAMGFKIRVARKGVNQVR